LATDGGAEEDDAMEHAAEWVERLLEEAGGRAAAAVRAFVRAFPPAALWGDPWPAGAAEAGLPAFAPSAPSYAAALREVAGGRRRVRVQGRWSGGERGAVHAGAARSLAEEAAWSVLAADR
jgi:hypothetical protein